MRLRIQTYNPLPEIKAWFIPDVQSVPESVYDLKEALCLRFQALKACKFSSEDLVLLLDDFELLNDTPFSAVRDGDLICVKLSPLAQVEDVVETELVRKRKRSTSAIPGRSVRAPTVLPSFKQKATKLSKPFEGSDSESDSTTSSSASSSSSSSSSSLSTSLSSSSTSSFSLPPKPLTFQPTQQTRNIRQPIDNMTVTNSSSRIIPLVPPGHGKPSTHSRNKRRRLKKGYEKELLPTVSSIDPPPRPPKGSSHTNQLPLGQRKSESGPSSHPPNHEDPLLSAKPPTQLPSTLHTSTDSNLTQQDREGLASDVASALNNAFGMNAPDGDISGILISDEHSRNENISDSYITQKQVMMGSLRNKNKKKGFKQSMAAPIPSKITFTSNTMASGSQEQQRSSSTLMDGLSTSSEAIQPRLIPPSEIQELGQLPSNVFVTSVDVESEMWNEHPSSQKKQRKKKKNLNGERYSAPNDSSQMEGIASENGRFDDADDSSLMLPYFDTDVQTATQLSADTALEASRLFNWDRAEKLWKDCVVLDKLEQLVVGCLVGWKALAINPQTSSPEMLLMIARVVNIGQGSALIASESTQSIVIRYLQRPEAGRAALAFGLNGVTDEEQDEETLEWTDIVTRQWRVMTT